MESLDWERHCPSHQEFASWFLFLALEISSENSPKTILCWWVKYHNLNLTCISQIISDYLCLKMGHLQWNIIVLPKIAINHHRSQGKSPHPISGCPECCHALQPPNLQNCQQLDANHPRSWQKLKGLVQAQGEIFRKPLFLSSLEGFLHMFPYTSEFWEKRKYVPCQASG